MLTNTFYSWSQFIQLWFSLYSNINCNFYFNSNLQKNSNIGSNEYVACCNFLTSRNAFYISHLLNICFISRCANSYELSGWKMRVCISVCVIYLFYSFFFVVRVSERGVFVQRVVFIFYSAFSVWKRRHRQNVTGDIRLLHFYYFFTN